MAVSLKLGIDQFLVNRYFKPASFGWHQGDRFDFRLKVFQKVGCQTGSAIGVVSDGAVYDLNFHQHFSSPGFENKTPAGDATGVESQLHALINRQTDGRRASLAN
jgi:hypothetical protein